ncbi:MAG TPA: formimidoylglutamate deiminase [Xanthomonadaceae bacterium]|nr:formimidoylglutamate deiminase [Xanthomonadaceae bacterium]
MPATRLVAKHAWLSDGWHDDVALRIDAEGNLDRVEAGTDATPDARYLLPGIPNAHSHAFQRAMAGLAERRGHPEDSFWSWRKVMYEFASRIDPDALQAIAAQLYTEMLRAGYTSVCEFHYLHHDRDGRPYTDPAAMSKALIAAAEETGIGLTLLPVLYMTGGFDGRPLNERQRRFGHDVHSYLRLLDALVALESPQLRVGVAFHSLRAVPEAAMHEVRSALEDFGSVRAVHIHIAEQIGEVQDSLAVRDARPVEWLLDHLPVDFRWTLVHATHMTAEETRRVAESSATVALCPTTEANLGDGLFPLRAYIDAGGLWSIGSDSHVSVSPVEELRWLEYGQRLTSGHRNVAASEALPSVGETLFSHALAGGGRSAGRSIGWFEGAEPDRGIAGTRADLLVLDEAAVELAARDTGNLVDTWLFSGNRNLVRDVMVGGKWRVRAGEHVDAARIAERYRRTVAGLSS